MEKKGVSAGEITDSEIEVVSGGAGKKSGGLHRGFRDDVIAVFGVFRRGLSRE